MVKSVVATGKVEPITKIEIKSKANGIIKVLNADIDRAVKAGDILVELDREQLAATLRGAEANLQAARASLEGAEAQLQKNIVEAEGPDEQFARRAYERAQNALSPSASSRSRRWTTRTAWWTWRKTASAPRSRSWPSRTRR